MLKTGSAAEGLSGARKGGENDGKFIRAGASESAPLDRRL